MYASVIFLHHTLIHGRLPHKWQTFLCIYLVLGFTFKVPSVFICIVRKLHPPLIKAKFMSIDDDANILLSTYILLWISFLEFSSWLQGFNEQGHSRVNVIASTDSLFNLTCQCDPDEPSHSYWIIWRRLLLLFQFHDKRIPKSVHWWHIQNLFSSQYKKQLHKWEHKSKLSTVIWIQLGDIQHDLVSTTASQIPISGQMISKLPKYFIDSWFALTNVISGLHFLSIASFITQSSRWICWSIPSESHLFHFFVLIIFETSWANAEVGKKIIQGSND